MAVLTQETKKSGRPKKEINWVIFEDLCQLQCTQSEIASVLHVHVDTLRDRAQAYYEEDFSNIYKRYSEGGKASLRRYQMNIAKKNAGMAIFLGKQYLGQKDSDHVLQMSPEMNEQFKSLMNQIRKRQEVS